MIKDVVYIENFIPNPNLIFHHLNKNIDWDLRMKSRKTASFGVAYNYSQISYASKNMIPEIEDLSLLINKYLKFKPNNCLINLYENGNSKMGFHSDQIDILAKNTGVVIVSLGQERILQFRNIVDKEIKFNYSLKNGSLLYMNQETQLNWQHSIPKDESTKPRMSITFRNLIQSKD